MKNVALTISLTLISLLSFGQLDSLSKNVLKILLRQQHPTGILYYTDKLEKEVITRIKTAVKNQNYFASHRETENDTIFLSAAEKKFINSEINKWSKVVWDDSLVKKSTRISVDSMWPRIQRKNRETLEAYYKDTSEAGRAQFIDKLVKNSNTFQFSPIIFLRNKSIFLTYIFRGCGGLCGEYSLAFYKLQNGVYKKWILVMGGVF
jgi:hypothetical protein